MSSTGLGIVLVLMYLMTACGTEAPQKPFYKSRTIQSAEPRAASSEDLEEQEFDTEVEEEEEEEAPSEEELAAQAAAQQAILFKQEAKQAYDMTCAGCHGEAAASNLNGRDPAITALTLMNAAGVVFHNDAVDALLPDSLEKGEGFLSYLADPASAQ